MTKKQLKELGDKIRKARIDKDVGFREMSRRSGVALSSIWQIETGRVAPEISTLRKIAKVLGMRVVVELSPADRTAR